MLNDPEDAGAGQYVHKVVDSTRRYVRELLTENGKLRSLVASLETENGQLREERLRVQERLLAMREEMDRTRAEEVTLQRKLATVETEHRHFAEQFEVVEQQNSNLANLYVASYRLHGTLDREEVLSIIKEIIINLVGCEELAIFEVEPKGGALSLIGFFGIDPGRYQSIPLNGGPIGQAVVKGETYLCTQKPKISIRSSPEEAELTACIPLKLGDTVTGAIALFRLLPQKPGLEALDHELLDLLASHAAMALYCTSLHARTAPRIGMTA